MIIAPQPRDIENQIISGSISELPWIGNYSGPANNWTQITIEYSDSKQLLLQPRDEITWELATVSGGSFFTMRNGAALETPLVTVSGNLVCWVWAAQSTIFELLLGR